MNLFPLTMLMLLLAQPVMTRTASQTDAPKVDSSTAKAQPVVAKTGSAATKKSSVPAKPAAKGNVTKPDPIPELKKAIEEMKKAIEGLSASDEALGTKLDAIETALAALKPKAPTEAPTSPAPATASDLKKLQDKFDELKTTVGKLAIPERLYAFQYDSKWLWEAVFGTTPKFTDDQVRAIKDFQRRQPTEQYVLLPNLIQSEDQVVNDRNATNKAKQPRLLLRYVIEELAARPAKASSTASCTTPSGAQDLGKTGSSWLGCQSTQTRDGRNCHRP